MLPIMTHPSKNLVSDQVDAPVLGPEVNLPLEPGVGAYDEAGAVLTGGAVTRALAVVSRARHR